MPKKRRQAKIPTPAWDRPRGTIGSRVLGRGFQFYGAIVIGLLMAAGLGVVGYAFLADELESQRRPGSTAIQVDDTRFRLDYFASRVTMFLNQNGGQATDVQQRAGVLAAVSDLVIREEIVRRFAGDFDVTATDEEIREAIASGEGPWSGLGITADDDSFDLVLQQQLARSGISEPDLRQMMEAAVLQRKLRDEFLEQVPKSAESVRYRQIVVSDQERADELVAEIESGGDFAALAAENSLDTTTRDNGGELGWVPRGVLDAEEDIFALEPGAVGTVSSPAGVFVIEMLEKDNERPVEEDQKEVLAGRLLDDWVAEKMEPLSIVNNMDLTDGDPDKINWAVDSARG